MTKVDIKRFCAGHGDLVLLADCAIVATNKLRNEAERDRLGEGSFGGADPGGDPLIAGFVPSTGPLGAERTHRRMPATLAPEVGTMVKSRVDGDTRLVLANPYGRRALQRRGLARLGPLPDLPSPVDMARDPLAGPARACPRCCHPFAVEVDDRDQFPVAVVGHQAATKTSTILALMEAVDSRGPKILGVPEFAATTYTGEYLDQIDPKMRARYREAARTPGTDPGFKALRTPGTDPDLRHPPLQFLTTLAPTARRPSEEQAILLMQDVAGEHLMNHQRRPYVAPITLWADAVVFVYNPDAAPTVATAHASGQASLLNAVREDIQRSGRPLPPLLVAISKADKLSPRPAASQGPAPQEQARAVLERLGDAAMLDAARQWRRPVDGTADGATVQWFFIAPLPEDDSQPQGVPELFRTLLSLL